MATTQSMIQFDTLQSLDSAVSDVAPIDDEAFIFLDPSRKTIVREIAVEKAGGIAAFQAPGFVPVGLDQPFVELILFRQGKDDEEFFFGPSYVPSPEILGAIGAILRVQDIGISIGSPGKLKVLRRLGTHAYIDQVD
jgi:hypothetical protein